MDIDIFRFKAILTTFHLIFFRTKHTFHALFKPTYVGHVKPCHYCLKKNEGLWELRTSQMLKWNKGDLGEWHSDSNWQIGMQPTLQYYTYAS